MKRILVLLVVVFFNIYHFCNCYVIHKNNGVDDTNAVEANASISLKVVNKPHHLFIGRCNPIDEILHEENIILNNDGKSQVNATIRMNVEGLVYITCVKVLDQVLDGEGAYPTFVEGGVGYNYVVFNVTAGYGKGFDFYVQINGYSLEDENTIITD